MKKAQSTHKAVGDYRGCIFAVYGDAGREKPGIDERSSCFDRYEGDCGHLWGQSRYPLPEIVK